jgi:hypothetical protein
VRMVLDGVVDRVAPGRTPLPAAVPAKEIA